MKPTVIFGFDMETDIGSWTPFYEGLVHGTPRLLELLDRHRITATFFFTGDAARSHPEVVKAVASAGHEVGCHSLYHETLGDEIIPILAALQYILRLIVAHQQKARVPLTVDVEGYKQRRYGSLRELALRLAQKAVSTRQSMTLEPMPADERRIVHLALSVNPDVVTQSVGEGELRKVVIMPRKR